MQSGYATIASNVDVGNGNDWTDTEMAVGAPNGSGAKSSPPFESATNNLRLSGFSLDNVNATNRGKFIVRVRAKSSALSVAPNLSYKLGDDSGDKTDMMIAGTMAQVGNYIDIDIDVYATMTSNGVPRSQIAGLRMDQLAVSLSFAQNDVEDLLIEVDSCFVDVTTSSASSQGSSGGGASGSVRTTAMVSPQMAEIIVPIRLVIQVVTGEVPEADGGPS